MSSSADRKPPAPERPGHAWEGLELERPAPAVVVVRELGQDAGFLTMRRFELALAEPSGTSAPFPYDVVERRSLDAAAIVAHFVRDAVRYVVLRSALRPPFALAGEPGFLWELPAGLIEPGEAPIEAAARELNEEIGTAVSGADLAPLGPPVIPVPAMIAERQFLFHVEIDPDALVAPEGDGSALERWSTLAFVPLERAIDLTRSGKLPDAKTELGLRRLREVLG